MPFPAIRPRPLLNRSARWPSPDARDARKAREVIATGKARHVEKAEALALAKKLDRSILRVLPNGERTIIDIPRLATTGEVTDFHGRLRDELTVQMLRFFIKNDRMPDPVELSYLVFPIPKS